MTESDITKLKHNIIAIGHLLWNKDLVTGLNGNISARINTNEILITGHGTCLGLLQDKDIVHMTLTGEVLNGGDVSSEKLLHTEIYKNYSDVNAVIHTHTTYTNAYFLDNKKFSPQVFEAKIYLGDIEGVDQHTPAVTDTKPVIDMLKNNNIAVLRRHGVVAMGAEHFDCFLLIQGLEEATKTAAVARLFQNQSKESNAIPANKKSILVEEAEKFKLFSQKQIDAIVKLVNQDEQLQKLGTETAMVMDLAVKLNETGQTYSFSFNNGRIDKVGNDEDAEFLITAPENVWRSVFNQEIDPFVATTQKKMHLRGDFAKISQWYAPCSRVFELWQQVPIE